MTQAIDSRAEKALSQAIKDRRATPSFSSDPVPENDLKKILEAGLFSPRAYNLQPWRFVVGRAAEERARLRQGAMKQPQGGETPGVLITWARLEGWRHGDLHGNNR